MTERRLQSLKSLRFLLEVPGAQRAWGSPAPRSPSGAGIPTAGEGSPIPSRRRNSCRPGARRSARASRYEDPPSPRLINKWLNSEFAFTTQHLGARELLRSGTGGGLQAGAGATPREPTDQAPRPLWEKRLERLRAQGIAWPGCGCACRRGTDNLSPAK